MGRKKLLNRIGKKVKKAAKKVATTVKKAPKKVATTVKKAPKKVANTVKKAPKKIVKGVKKTAKDVVIKVKETDISIGVKVKGSGIAPKIAISNSGTGKWANLNKKIGLRIGFKRLLIKKDKKWIELLHKRLKIESKTDITKNIYYVNGIATDIRKGTENNTCVNNYFDINSKLIFNPTLGPDGKKFPAQAPFDVPELKKDYDWFLSTKDGKKIDKSVDYSWFFTTKIDKIIRKPIDNPVTIAVIALLYEGKSKNAPLGLIASSQGTLITFNAIVAFSKLGKDNLTYLKNKVKVCHVGCIVPKPRVKFIKGLILKYDFFANVKDGVARFVGQRASVKGIVNSSSEFHSVPWYLPHKDNFNFRRLVKLKFTDAINKEYKDAVKHSKSKPYNMRNGELIRIEKFVPYNFFLT